MRTVNIDLRCRNPFRPICSLGVYAEDYILDAAAEEFSETPLMEEANTKLYGPYRWGRYDLIVLPPSFPYGGMENPRLRIGA